eukprot:CAMPEP_0206488366 /NCGR_PEP_ID=MMETSP0324_2-20121206/42362_1 /ASSEMBLY_ACC=CAM_ASM_000836 /TAXON_ID=2866 /ORGANISM="Crypthecodinium cohnii, Strain Seligo" /LENGTH=357 /DNA_ID=CAMNT_0053967361 /DNA_START=1114 /DNA_END=2183 /DNA_ORIENTATION=-
MSEEKTTSEESQQSHDERVTCAGLGWVSYILRASPQQQSAITLPEDPAMMRCVGLRFTSSLEVGASSGDSTTSGGSSSSSSTLSSAGSARGTNAGDVEDTSVVANERPSSQGSYAPPSPAHTSGISAHKGKLNSSASTSVALFCAGQLSLTLRNNFSSYQPLSAPRCNGVSMRVERPTSAATTTSSSVPPAAAPAASPAAVAPMAAVEEEEVVANRPAGVESTPGRPRELPNWVLSQLPFAGFVTRYLGPPTPENYEQAQQTWEAIKTRSSHISSLMSQTTKELEGPQHFFKQTAAKVGKISARSLKILQRTGELLTLQNRPAGGTGEDEGSGGGSDDQDQNGGSRNNRWGRKPGPG